jgi:hypothetical protein
LITALEGEVVPKELIPPCFSDPDLTSGVCNPNVPLKPGEAFLCRLHGSCLVAKLLASKAIPDPATVKNLPYNERLLTLREDRAVQHQPDEHDRDRLRISLLTWGMRAAVNPFRAKSSKWHAFEILRSQWTTLKHLRQQLRLLTFTKESIELALLTVTALPNQELHGYRIVESQQEYRVYAR